MMRHVFAAFLLLLVLLLPGCSTAGGSSGSQNGSQPLASNGSPCPAVSHVAPNTSESGDIVLTAAGWVSSPTEDALVQSNLQRFEQMHPHIQIKWAPITSGDYSTFMRANLVNGHAPDVFYLAPTMAPDYMSSKLLLNLTPYMARDNIPASMFDAALLAPFTCASQAYALPKDWSTLGVFYNKQMLQQAGLPTPPQNWTWDDLRLYARKLTVIGNNYVYGITMPSLSSRWLAFLLAKGGAVLSADGKQAIFNNQAGVDALNFYASFQKEDGSSVIPAQLVSPSWRGDSLEAFGERRVAMVVEGSWLIPYMQQHFSSVQYGIAPLPTAPGGKRADLLFTNGWAAYVNTPHAEAAWQFIKYMTSQEAQQHMIQTGFALPTLSALANDAALEPHPELRVFLDARPYSSADYFGVHDEFIHNKLDLAINSVLTGSTDAQTALNTAALQIDQALQS